MIRLLFQDASISIDINKQVTKPFALHRAVRQGYPLPPYLCIIMEEALNAATKNALRLGNLKGIVLPQSNSQQTISQYVDDTSFTVRAEEASADNLVGILHKFGIAYGLEINWHKSVAYWCG